MLGVGASALLVDRVVLNSGVSGPALAAASSASVGGEPGVEGVESPAPVVELDSVGRRLESLRTASGGSTLTDAFGAVAGWFPAPDRKQVSIRAGTPGPAAVPVQKSRLTGMGRNFATVDGHVIQVGGPAVKGLRLVSVDIKSRTVVIEEGSVRTVLKMAASEFDGRVSEKK